MNRKRVILLICLCSIFIFSLSCKKQYTVNFYDFDGDIIETVKVNKGQSVSGPTLKEIEGYTFTGWDQSLDEVTSNLDVNAIYTKNKYNVVFKDIDGNILKEEVVLYGDSATAPEEPILEHQIFIGWDQSFVNITSDLEIKPLYNIEKCNVIFKDINGNIIKEQLIEYGKSAIAPELSLVEGYTFTGWDQSFENVTSNLEVKPIYEKNKYNVVFKDIDGNVLKEEVVLYGESATAPKAPYITGYKFDSWDIEFTYVTSHLEIKPIYNIEVLKVTFTDMFGNILKVEYVEYGSAATAPEAPIIEGYEFVGWNRSFDNIRLSVGIKAMYEKIITSGLIEYYDGVQHLDLYPGEYNYGDSFDLPIPFKEGYDFVGWYLDYRSMTEYISINEDTRGNLTLYARFIEIKRNIVLPDSDFKFEGIKHILHSSGTFYVYQPIIPATASTKVTDYNWSTSDPTIATVSAYSSISIVSAGYCVLTGVHKTEHYTINCLIKVTPDGIDFSTVEEANNLILHNITFKGKDGEIIKETKCFDNGSVIYPAAPVYEGYRFTGWDKSNYNITTDTVINATYEEGSSRYEGKSFAIIGDSISTYDSFVPAGYDTFYPYPTADVTDVNKTWWMQVINKLGGTLLSNNSYSGTTVAGGTYATCQISRLEKTLISDQAPDVILIFMGSNDCASKYVTYEEFYKAYDQMIVNLQKLCPNSEIILCTLPYSNLYTNEKKSQFNDAIREYATKYDLKTIEMDDVSIEDHLVDSAHPNTSGMNIIADVVIEELLK